MLPATGAEVGTAECETLRAAGKGALQPGEAQARLLSDLIIAVSSCPIFPTAKGPLGKDDLGTVLCISRRL